MCVFVCFLFVFFFVFFVFVGEEAKTIAVAEQYGNATGIMHYTVIIDRKGSIAYVQYGELPEELAREVIKSLL